MYFQTKLMIADIMDKYEAKIMYNKIYICT